MAKEPETSRIEEQNAETPRIEEEETPTASRYTRKSNEDSDSTTTPSTAAVAKTLESLQKQISHIDEVTNNTGKQLKMLDSIQAHLSQLEKRITIIEHTSGEMLSIVQRIKIKKKKGGKKSKK